MKNFVPITNSGGTTLSPPEGGISRVTVRDASERTKLSWDRYVRLEAAAKAIKEIAGTEAKILDVGGYDGALALFLENYLLELADPATTGASISDLALASKSYDIVVAVDALEHIPPDSREAALDVCARLAKSAVIINYPCEESRPTQELVFKITGNSLIKEHVEWPLPNTAWVEKIMVAHGFKTSVTEHASLAVWFGQYIAMQMIPEHATEINQHFVDYHADELFSKPLYHLVVCRRLP